MWTASVTSVAVIACVAAATLPWGQTVDSADTAETHHQRGVEHHLERSLDEASREYARAIELEPTRALTAEELEVVRRFAPRIYTTPREFFGLKDFAVILHPQQRLIAYHFFWEDDIDFPEDNDPCDHELMWVEYAPDRQSLQGIWTYFHGRLLEGGEAAMNDARQHHMRPRVNVQWGKHGSMPAGWEDIRLTATDQDIERKYLTVDTPVTLSVYNEAAFRKLKEEGRRLRDDPIARRLQWPERFDGTWRDFVDFSRLIDPLTMFERTKMARVSRWNSATIDREFLPYNFRPKTEWPVEDPPGESRALTVSARSLEDFQLPPRTLFDKSMPRYPNVWFYVDASLAASYESAVRLVTDRLRQTMGLRELFGPFDNPEGSDFETRLEHLQPWQIRSAPALQHSHAFHMRYYYSALARHKAGEVTLRTAAGIRPFFRFAASAHYEVEHTNPNHADVESCPICGRTGAYRDLSGNLVETVHDPLGLELLTKGTIRGEVVRFEDRGQPPVGSVAALPDLAVQPFVFQAMTGDRNTLRIGVVVITAKTR